MARVTQLNLVMGLPMRAYGPFTAKEKAVVVLVSAERRVFILDTSRRILIKDTARRTFEKDTKRRIFKT